MNFFKKLGVDLGTANSLIWEGGRGVVVNEPTMVAVGVEDGRVLAVGNEAKEMLGKTPEYIEVIRPMEDGVISDYSVTEAMLKHFLKMAMGAAWFLGPEVMVCVPSGVTQVEQRAVMDAVLAAGSRKAYVIDAPLAAAIGARIPVSEPSGNMIVGIGAGVAEAAVISLGGVVAAKSLRVAGNRIDRSIAEFLRKKDNLIVGDLAAEELKIRLGSAIKLKRPEKTEVGGRDAVSGLPKTVELTSDDVYEAIRPVLDQILVVVRETLELTPPELVADIVDKGIVIYGGTAQLRNLNVLMTREIGVSARVAIEPQNCVIRGTGVAIENLEVYQRAVR